MQLLSHIWQWHPLVGVCIAALGLLGVLVPLIREKIGRREKAAWTLLLLALLLYEIKSVYQDRNEHDREQAALRTEQLAEFNRIADGMERSIVGMEKLMSEATGGDSYLYFDVGDPGGPTEIPAPGIIKGNIAATAIPDFVGDFPLHDVIVHASCPFGWMQLIDYGTMYPHEIGRPRQGIYLQFPSTTVRQADCYLLINTSNGSYFQIVRFLKEGDKWTWGSRFMKYGRPNEWKQEHFGDGFPRDEKWQ
jgi:hypothetical protein